MTYYDSEDSRLCTSCKMTRIPDKKIVKKKGKTWAIYTCKICKMKDIEPYVPIKIFDGQYFVDETIEGPDEK